MAPAETSGQVRRKRKSQPCDDHHRFENGARFEGLLRSAEVTSGWLTIRELSGCGSNRNGQYGPFFRGYNRGNLCLSLQAHILAHMKSRRLSARAAWAKCIAHDVAITVLPEALRRDSERLSGFQREARLLAAPNHSQVRFNPSSNPMRG